MVKILIRSQGNLGMLDQDFDSDIDALNHIESIKDDKPIGTKYYVIKVLKELQCDEEVKRKLVEV